MSVANALKDLKFELDSSACRRLGDEFESVSERSDRIVVRKSSGRVLRGEHQETDGLFIIAPFFEMQGEFRRPLQFVWSAVSLEPLADAPMQFGPVRLGKPPVEGLPIE